MAYSQLSGKSLKLLPPDIINLVPAGLRPIPCWEADSTPPDPLARFKGPYF